MVKKTRLSEIVWSADEENYPYSSLGELLECNDHLVDGDIVFYGEVHKPTPESLINIEYDLLDSISERAYEVAGEWAEDFPYASSDAVKLLERYVCSWIKKYTPINFFIVINVKEYVITAEDL